MKRAAALLTACFASFSPINLPSAAAAEMELILPAPIDNADYSAGIFDGSGLLVRTLAGAEPEAQLPKALNGLVLRWDGKDEEGSPLPAAPYSVSALAIPSLEVEGVRYLFNDWIDDAPALRVVRPLAGFQRADGAIAALLYLDENKQAVAWIDPEGKTVALLPLPDDLPLGVATCDGDTLYLAGLASVHRIPWGATTLDQAVAEENPVMALDASADGIAVLRSDGTAGVMDSSGEVSGAGLGTLPDVRRFVRTGGRWLALGAGGNLHEWKESAWEPLTLPGVSQVQWLTAGVDHTFWVLEGDSDGGFSAAQFGTDPDPLRTLELPTGARGVFLSQLSAETLLLIEETDGGTRFRGLRLETPSEPTPSEPTSGAKHPPVSIWHEAFLRTVANPSNYTIENGLPIPSAEPGDPPAAPQIALKPNPLSQEPAPKLTVSAALTPQGVWLSTADGLLIREISSQDRAQWGFVTAGESPGAVRLFEGLPWGIAEYVVRGVDGVIEIDLGTVTLPDDLREGGGVVTPEPPAAPTPSASPLPPQQESPAPTPASSPFPSSQVP